MRLLISTLNESQNVSRKNASEVIFSKSGYLFYSWSDVENDDMSKGSPYMSWLAPFQDKKNFAIKDVPQMIHHTIKDISVAAVNDLEYTRFERCRKDIQLFVEQAMLVKSSGKESGVRISTGDGRKRRTKVVYFIDVSMEFIRALCGMENVRTLYDLLVGHRKSL